MKAKSKCFFYSLIILQIFSFLTSCQPPRQDYIRGILTNVCFWDVLDEDFNAKKVKYAYRLLPNGTCYQYGYHYIDDKKQKSVSPIEKQRGEVDIKWHLKGDSLLILGEVDYKIEKVEKDAIWLQSSFKNNLLLQKNCSTFIID